MARLDIGKVTLAGTDSPGYVNLNSPEKLTNLVALDDGQAVFESGMMLIVHNRGTGAATVIVPSVLDSQGRLDTVADAGLSVGAGAVAIFGPFLSEGWRQSDGYIYVNVDTDDVWVGVINT